MLIGGGGGGAAGCLECALAAGGLEFAVGLDGLECTIGVGGGSSGMLTGAAAVAAVSLWCWACSIAWPRT